MHRSTWRRISVQFFGISVIRDRLPATLRKEASVDRWISLSCENTACSAFALGLGERTNLIHLTPRRAHQNLLRRIVFQLWKPSAPLHAAVPCRCRFRFKRVRSFAFASSGDVCTLTGGCRQKQGVQLGHKARCGPCRPLVLWEST